MGIVDKEKHCTKKRGHIENTHNQSAVLNVICDSTPTRGIIERYLNQPLLNDFDEDVELPKEGGCDDLRPLEDLRLRGTYGDRQLPQPQTRTPQTRTRLGKGSVGATRLALFLLEDSWKLRLRGYQKDTCRRRFGVIKGRLPVAPTRGMGSFLFSFVN